MIIDKIICNYSDVLFSLFCHYFTSTSTYIICIKREVKHEMNLMETLMFNCTFSANKRHCIIFRIKKSNILKLCFFFFK